MLSGTHGRTTLFLALLLGHLVACGGDDESTPPPPPPSQCPPGYSLSFLPPSATSSSALSLNNVTPSQVVGEVGGDAAVWNAGSFSAIPNTFGGSNSIAFDVNGSGRIVGGAETTTPNVFRAFLFTGGTMTDLGTLGGSSSFATGINNAGHIVGSSNIPTSESHAFLRDSVTMRDLGTLGGSSSEANGINSGGQIVGNSQVAGNGSRRAFLYDGVMRDLGTLGGQNSNATAINDAGQVVGYSQLAGQTDDHAFLYSGDRMQELSPSTVSTAWSINNTGHIVGSMAISPTRSHAFRYCEGTLTDLNTLIPAGAGELLDAFDINDQGEIVGIGTMTASPGLEQAVVLTPQ